MDYKRQIEELKNLEAIAYGYSNNGEVLGMDCSDFEQLMVDAVESITDLLARAEKAESERDAIITAINNAYRMGAITVNSPKFRIAGTEIEVWCRTVKREQE